jgi:carbon storage regulator
MLVLSRKSRESVVIGGSSGFQRTLKITVLEIRGQSVRLGFEADTDIAVHRWEVWERICAVAGPDARGEGRRRPTGDDARPGTDGSPRGPGGC